MSNVPVVVHKFRKGIPKEHQVSLDTRLVWLWHQRFGTVQTIYNTTKDVLDATACTLVLQAIMAEDLDSIAQLFQRLEGGALVDSTLIDQEATISV